MSIKPVGENSGDDIVELYAVKTKAALPRRSGAVTIMRVLSVCACATLSACGSQTGQSEVGSALFSAVKDLGKKLPSKASGKTRGSGSAQAKTAAPDPNAIVTAALAATTGPIALVVSLKTQGVLAMNPVGQNADYVTWGSVVGQGVTQKHGVITSTRGLGEDLMASKIDRAIAAITARDAASYQRIHYYLDGVWDTQETLFNCQLSELKVEHVSLGEIDAEASVMKEDCRASKDSSGPAKDAAFTNVYWVDDAGKVLKSSQWISKKTGGLVVQNLRL